MLLKRPQLRDDARAAPTRLGLDARVWNWHADAADAKASPANYYEASLADWMDFPALRGDQRCEVLVVGGGLLGAATALHLAQAGVDVILVEKDSIGSAASGRNGGQLTPGLARWEAADMMAHFPLPEARRLWRFASIEAMTLIDRIADTHGLDFDRRHGHVTAAVHPGHLAALVEGADARRCLGDAGATVVGRHALREMVASDNYHGGCIDAVGGQLHPLALLRGMAYGFVHLGGRVHERTEVLDIQQQTHGAMAFTDGGVITASRGVVLAVHSGTFRFLSSVSTTTVPFHTYVGVTQPLPMPVADLLPAGMPVYDTQFQIDYYRAVRRNRLLFGGQGTGTSWAPERINEFLRDRIRSVFPQLVSPVLEYSWSGISDFTLNGATDCRRIDGPAPLYLVHGWSGHGVAQTVRIGKAISDDLIGSNDDFEMLARIGHAEIPLGRQLSPVAIPLAKAAMGVVGAVSPGRMVSF